LHPDPTTTKKEEGKDKKYNLPDLFPCSLKCYKIDNYLIFGTGAGKNG
jgi:hypothetical protein